MAVQTSEDTSGLRPYHPYHTNIFYRVFDNSSAGSYEHNRFQSAASVLRPDDPASYFTEHDLEAHLNWGNRQATPYISIYANKRRALGEARRRSAEGNVLRGEVQVAEIRGLDELERNDVFCVSTSELLREGLLRYSSPLGRFIIHDEWFVLGEIPAACVVAVWSVDEFEKKVNPVRAYRKLFVQNLTEIESGDGKSGEVVEIKEMDDLVGGMGQLGIQSVGLQDKAITKPLGVKL